MIKKYSSYNNKFDVSRLSQGVYLFESMEKS